MRKKLKISLLLLSLVFLSGTIFVISCSKEKGGTQSNENSSNVQFKSGTVRVISKIHTGSEMCDISKDSICIIDLTYQADGTVNYSYSFAPVTDSSKWATYSLDQSYTIYGDSAVLNLDSTKTYWAIAFDDPTTAERAPTRIVFTCECCSAQGHCSVGGSCCPNEIHCENGDCNGDCGLDARRAFSHEHSHHVILEAVSVNLVN